MALVTLCGYPCSGKTSRKEEIVAEFQKRISSENLSLNVKAISDSDIDASHHAITSIQDEKTVRGTFLSNVIRSLAKDTIVIADSLNHIKGFRYQLYCAARELQIRSCVVYVAAPAGEVRSWNEKSENAYPQDKLNELINCFEEPNPSVRWDAPLITLFYTDPLSSVADQIWNAAIKGEVKPPNAATVYRPPSSHDYLTILETTTSAIVRELLQRQDLAPLSGPTPIQIDGVQVSVSATRHVTPAQLQRLKIQFTNLNRWNAVELDMRRLASLFAEYLSSHLSR